MEIFLVDTPRLFVFQRWPAKARDGEIRAADGLGGPARAVVHVCRHRDCPRLWLIWVDSAGQGGTEDLLLTHAEAVRRVAGPTCASIGVFHVGDGRITEVFNCGYQHGVWT